MDYIDKLTPSQKKKIAELENGAINKKKIKGEDVINLIEEIFNPSGIYTEAHIPSSFLTSDIGNVLFGALYNSDYYEELTVTTVSDELNISKQYINKCIKTGKIQAKYKGGVWFIRRSEVEKFNNSRK